MGNWIQELKTLRNLSISFRYSYLLASALFSSTTVRLSSLGRGNMTIGSLGLNICTALPPKREGHASLLTLVRKLPGGYSIRFLLVFWPSLDKFPWPEDRVSYTIGLPWVVCSLHDQYGEFCDDKCPHASQPHIGLYSEKRSYLRRMDGCKPKQQMFPMPGIYKR